MRRFDFAAVCRLFTFFLLAFVSVSAQSKNPSVVEVKTLSEEELLPSVIKSLPYRENAAKEVVYIKSAEELRRAVGEQPILDGLDFTGGTEAAAAVYDAGRLLIVEYTTPQTSVEGDSIFSRRLEENSQNPPVIYRRIGNYSAFVFNPKDEATANALLDQVKYSKTVQWLGANPNALRRAEEAFARTTGQIFLSTFLAIGVTLLSTFLLGAVVGIIFFYLRKRQRAAMTKFSDAGGMTRLNLDDLTEMPAPAGLLND